MSKYTFLIAAILVILLALQEERVEGQYLGGEKRRSFKYVYKPYTFADSVHPKWWKRSEGQMVFPAYDEEFEGERGGFEGDKGGYKSIMSNDMCLPENYWRVGDKICIPLMCALDPKVAQIKKGDCVCVIPYDGFCKTVQ